MCGLVGFFLPKHVTPRIANLDRMVRALGHRGPDSLGQYISPDKRYQAAFARLAVLDLKTGHQPIVANDENMVLMANGEIYNYLDIKKAYPNYKYLTNSDVEPILPLYKDLGERYVNQLNGMFAIAIYDSALHKLTLTRDRLGIKPLYWAKTIQGGIIFASEIKALLVSGLIDQELNWSAGPKYLSLGYVPSPETLFSGIYKLPPGHSLTVDSAGAVKIESYWNAAINTTLFCDFREAVENLTVLLKDSVRLQLISEVPIGALLSGGIDSGLIVALAAPQTSKPLSTFTVRFPGSKVDEAPLAKLVSDRYATDHHELEVDVNDVISSLPQAVWHNEEPLADPSLLPNFAVERALSKSVTVVLNGTGGDELFAGYGRYFQLPVEKFYNSIPPWLKQQIIEPFLGKISPVTRWKFLRSEKFFSDPGGYLHDHLTQFPGPILSEMGSINELASSIHSDYFLNFNLPHQSAMLATDISTYLPEDLLLLLDRTSMAFGIEGRVPFLDHRLVEAALSVSPEIRTFGNRQKALERFIAKDYLPKEILEAPKHGFASPVSSWIKSEAFLSAARKIICRREAVSRGWWTEAGVKSLFSNPVRNSFRIYSLLMLELSIIIHIENPPLDSPPTNNLQEYANAV